MGIGLPIAFVLPKTEIAAAVFGVIGTAVLIVNMMKTR